MRLDVQNVTMSHVNLLADLRVFNPNEKALTMQGVDYTLHLEGIKVFTKKKQPEPNNRAPGMRTLNITSVKRILGHNPALQQTAQYV